MGDHAIAAVLDAVFRIGEIPAALVAKRIKRTIAEQAIEILRIVRLMAGKIFTFLITEVGIMLPFPIRFLHNIHLHPLFILLYP